MVLDRFGRPLGSLRLSVTDRCNFRCQYCMPEKNYVWLPRQDLLTFEEIAVVAQAFVSLGVRRVRITGGEPLLRKDLPVLVELLAGLDGLEEIALTTNGVLLAEQAQALREAGLDRVTVSLDSLDAETFRRLARREGLPAVLEGLRAAARAGFTGIKLDTVVIRGENDQEIPALIRFAASLPAEVRFIEYMDVGGATRWTRDEVVTRAQMLETIASELGPVQSLPGRGSAPAERFRLEDGTTFGIIASVTEPFCLACDRARLTADGRWYTCLYSRQGVDLREHLRSGLQGEPLREFLAAHWQGRVDRGAEERLGLEQRSALIQPEILRRQPHLEMHTRGG